MSEIMHQTSALITGGSGFLGRYLIEELIANNYTVTILDRNPHIDSRIKVLSGNVEEWDTVREAVAAHDVVFHLAGLLGTSYLTDKARKTVDVNIGGALNIYEAIVGTDKRVVNAGLLPEWNNSYMITKKAAMRFGRMYSDIYNVSITTLEMTHVYGPRQRVAPYYKAVPTFITQALTNQPMTIYGDGSAWMDLVHAKDAARALRLAAEHPNLQGTVIPVGSGSRLRVIELAKKIIAMTGSSSELVHAPMRLGEPQHDPREMLVDSHEAYSLLGWKAAYSVDDGIRETIEWYRHNSLY